MKRSVRLSGLDFGWVVVVVAVGRREPCIENQEVVVGKYWGAWDCYCGRRNLGDFSNWGYMYLRRGYCGR